MSPTRLIDGDALYECTNYPLTLEVRMPSGEIHRHTYPLNTWRSWTATSQAETSARVRADLAAGGELLD